MVPARLFSRLAFAWVLLWPFVAAANFQFKFSVTNASRSPGDSVDLQVLFDKEKDQVEGWALGVCHDHTLLLINGVMVVARRTK